MTTNMITAARLLAHKTVNGRYQSLLALDGFPVLGHQMVSLQKPPALVESCADACLTVALDRHLHHRQRQLGLCPVLGPQELGERDGVSGHEDRGIARAPGLTVIRSVYADSSPDPQDDPKVETIVELLYRIWVGDTPAFQTVFFADYI